MIPTRWQSQLEAQLVDAERRLGTAERHLAAENGGRALEEAYPGVMAAALVKVWLTDEPWRRQRNAQELSRMAQEQLPSGFATLFEMKQHDQRGFTGWRAEDARPLIQEAAAFLASVRAEYDGRTGKAADR